MKLIYWDSNCFLAWLQQEPEGIEGCKYVLDMAGTGKCRIVTSTLTISEVLLYKGSKPILRNDRERVIKFFRQEYFEISPLTRPIAESSRELVWDYGIHPKDAIHVATALDAEVALLNTFDKKLISKGRHLDHLSIAAPQVGQARLFT